jgi:hypothetical protein
LFALAKYIESNVTGIYPLFPHITYADAGQRYPALPERYGGADKLILRIGLAKLLGLEPWMNTSTRNNNTHDHTPLKDNSRVIDLVGIQWVGPPEYPSNVSQKLNEFNVTFNLNRDKENTHFGTKRHTTCVTGTLLQMSHNVSSFTRENALKAISTFCHSLAEKGFKGRLRPYVLSQEKTVPEATEGSFYMLAKAHKLVDNLYLNLAITLNQQSRFEVPLGLAFRGFSTSNDREDHCREVYQSIIDDVSLRNNNLS